MTTKRFISFCKIWFIAVGAALSLVSLVVIFGWLSNNQTLVQIQPQFASMKFNTALSFLLTGGCFILLRFKQEITTRFVSGFILLLAISSLAEWIFQLDFGIDNLFVEDHFYDPTGPSGRMSIPTALCFALSGIAFILFTLRRRNADLITFVSIVGGLILAIGLIGVIDYGLSIFTQYGWQRYTVMAVHTTTSFCFIGLSFIILSLQQQNQETLNFSGCSLPFSTVLMMFCLTISIAIENKNTKQAQQLLSKQLTSQIEHVKQNLSFMTTTLQQVAKRWENQKALNTKSDWEKEGRLNIETLSFMQTIGLFDSHNTPFWFVSNDNNLEPTILNDIADQLNKTAQQETYLRCFESSNSNPIFVITIPLNIERELNGLLLATFDFSALFTKISIEGAEQDTWLRLDVGTHTTFSNANVNTLVIDQYTLTQQININGLPMVLTAGYLDNATVHGIGILSSTVFITGCLLVIVLMLNFYAYQKSNAYMNVLSNEKERFRLIIEAAPGAMILTNAEGVIELFNNKTNAVFGYEGDELLNKNVDILVPINHRTHHSKLRNSYKQNPGFRSMAKGLDLFGLHKNGQLIPLEIELCPIPTEQGLKILASIFDLSEKTKQLLELNRSKEELDRAGRIAKIGAWHFDLKTREMKWSPQTYKIFEVPQSEPLSFEFVQQFYSEEDAIKRKQAIDSAVQTGQEWQLEVLVTTYENNKIWVRSQGQVEFEKGEPVRLVGAIQDITEERMIVLELERRNQELNNFAYVASHDLKSPLRGIDQIATWLSEDLGETLDVKTQELLRLMRSRINRMEKLLDDLLSYARTSRIDTAIETVNVARLIEQIFVFCNTENAFELHISGDKSEYLVARTPLELVLRNLINNAMKHHDMPQGNVSISFVKLSNCLQFSVADDGPGIPLEHRERAFAMFQTLQPRDKIEGSGMGLAIVKKLIESFEGTIEITANQPRGAIFTFTWPAKLIPS
jgi:PAS domain S-box-containing protein